MPEQTGSKKLYVPARPDGRGPLTDDEVVARTLARARSQLADPESIPPGAEQIEAIATWAKDAVSHPFKIGYERRHTIATTQVIARPDYNEVLVIAIVEYPTTTGRSWLSLTAPVDETELLAGVYDETTGKHEPVPLEQAVSHALASILATARQLVAEYEASLRMGGCSPADITEDRVYPLVQPGEPRPAEHGGRSEAASC